MRPSHGQAVVEHLGVVICVASLMLATVAVARHTSLADAVRSALLGDPPAPRLLPEETALTMTALRGGDGAPRVDDTVALIASRVGEATAERLVALLAYETYAAATLGRANDESEVPTGLGSARVVSRRDELAAVSRLDRASRKNARMNVALDAAAIGAGVASAGVGLVAGGVAVLLQSSTGDAILPAGAEAGDVEVCLPIVWRSTAKQPRRVAPATLVAGGTPDVYRDRLRAIPAALVVVFRRGRAIDRRVAAFRGCR